MTHELLSSVQSFRKSSVLREIDIDEFPIECERKDSVCLCDVPWKHSITDRVLMIVSSSMHHHDEVSLFFRKSGVIEAKRRMFICEFMYSSFWHFWCRNDLELENHLILWESTILITFKVAYNRHSLFEKYHKRIVLYVSPGNPLAVRHMKIFDILFSELIFQFKIWIRKNDKFHVELFLRGCCMFDCVAILR